MRLTSITSFLLGCIVANAISIPSPRSNDIQIHNQHELDVFARADVSGGNRRGGGGGGGGGKGKAKAKEGEAAGKQARVSANLADLVPGRILWLPPKDQLPEKAVRRAHGKGAVEEGATNHPVVIVVGPDETGTVVFHPVRPSSGYDLTKK